MNEYSVAMTVIDTAEKWFSPRALARAALLVERLRAIAFDSDGRTAAQRMSLIAFAIRIVSAAIAFASQIVLARIMGEFEYGIFVFVWTLVVILGNLSCLGFHTAVIRFLPQYGSGGLYEEARGLTISARLTALVIASTLGAAGIAVLHFMPGLFTSYYVVPLYLGIFALPMIAMGDILDGTARANGWAFNALTPTYIVRPLLILLVMVAAVAAGAAHDARTALGCGLVATYATTLGQFLVVTWRLRRRYRSGTMHFAYRAWLAVSLPIFLIEGFYFLLTNSDVVVVGFFLDPDQVAIYFAAAKSMALVHFVYFAVKAGAGPRFAALVADPDRAALSRFAVETVRWTFWPSVAVGAAVLALGPFLLSLFGPAFADGEVVMAILLAGIMAKAMVGPGEVLLTMAGEQRICALVYAAVLVANIALDIVLIPAFGIAGAAVATALAMGVEAALLHIVVRRRLGVILFAFARIPHGAANRPEGQPR